MKLLELSGRRYVVVNFFNSVPKNLKRKGAHHGPLRPGLHVLVRWDDVWRHVKVTLIRQEGMRITSQKMVDKGMPRMYVTGYRLQLSVWKNLSGESGKGKAAKMGVMVYGTPLRQLLRVWR